MKHSNTAISLVEDTIVTEAKRSPVDSSSPYSWGLHRSFALSTREVATAVLDALAAKGRLLTDAALARFGGWCYFGGAAVGFIAAGITDLFDFPLLPGMAAGVLTGFVGKHIIRGAARRVLAAVERAVPRA